MLAFQRAFQGNEKVELVVKTSNVNPQHWSNTSGQWEKLLAASSGDRRIRIVTERYTNEEMTALVRDADASSRCTARKGSDICWSTRWRSACR